MEKGSCRGERRNSAAHLQGKNDREIGVSVHFISFLLKPIHGKLIADGI